MNNLKPFNLSGFNISGSAYEEDVDLSMYCYEKYQTTITFSKNSLIEITCSEKVLNNSRLTIAIDDVFELIAKLNLNSNLISYVIIETNNKEKININSNIYLNISDMLDVNEKINLEAYCGNNINFDLNADENIDLNLIFLMLNIQFQNILFSENLITNINSTVLSNVITRINTSMSGGQILEIDSDNFTCYLNDENILDKFSGDWINISRDIESIEISSTYRSKIKGKIIFRERFL